MWVAAIVGINIQSRDAAFAFEELHPHETAVTRIQIPYQPVSFRVFSFKDPFEVVERQIAKDFRFASSSLIGSARITTFFVPGDGLSQLDNFPFSDEPVDFRATCRLTIEERPPGPLRVPKGLSFRGFLTHRLVVGVTAQEPARGRG